MPLFMDVHNQVEGLTGEAVAGAHQPGLKVESKYGLSYLRYWFDEASGKVSWLMGAADEAAAEVVHREARGLPANDITQVEEGV